MTGMNRTDRMTKSQTGILMPVDEVLLFQMSHILKYATEALSNIGGNTRETWVMIGGSGISGDRRDG